MGSVVKRYSLFLYIYGFFANSGLLALSLSVDEPIPAGMFTIGLGFSVIGFLMEES